MRQVQRICQGAILLTLVVDDGEEWSQVTLTAGLLDRRNPRLILGCVQLKTRPLQLSSWDLKKIIAWQNLNITKIESPT